jgi:hypothetical protein
MVSFHDKFWAAAQLELAGLPKTDRVLAKLRVIHPRLHDRLRKGERWLTRRTRAPHELEAGWNWWIKNYRRAIRLVEEGLEGWQLN